MKSFSLTGEAFCLPEYQTSTPIIIWKQTLENMSKIYGARKAEDAARLTKAIDTEMNRYGISYDDIITKMKQDPLAKWL